MAWGGGVVCGGEIVWGGGSGAGEELVPGGGMVSKGGGGERVMCTSFKCAGAR